MGHSFGVLSKYERPRKVQAQKDAEKEANWRHIANNKAQAIVDRAQKEAAARRRHALEEKTRKLEGKAKTQAEK